jgi:hypothetical protein
MQEISLVLFAVNDVIGHHPGLVTLPQGFACIVVNDEVLDCVTRSFLADDERVNTGQGSYLVTAMMQCLGLAVRPGGTVAYARASTQDQASLIYREASESSPVPSDADNTAVVTGWPGAGWMVALRSLRLPDASPPTEWPVNAALRDLGVSRRDNPDEATALGLTLPTPPPSDQR